MYCSQCGKRNDEGSRFCSACGAPLKEMASAEAEHAPEHAADQYAEGVRAYAQQPEGGAANKKRLTHVLIAAAAAVFVGVLLCCLFEGRSWKSTLKSYMRSVTRLDMAGVLDVMPKAVLDCELEESGMTMPEIREQLKETGEEICFELEDALNDDYGMTLKEFLGGISYRIVKTEIFTKKELRELNVQFEEYYDAGADYVKSGKHVKLKLAARLDGDTESDAVAVDMINVGGKWYVSPYNSFDVYDMINKLYGWLW